MNAFIQRAPNRNWENCASLTTFSFSQFRTNASCLRCNYDNLGFFYFFVNFRFSLALLMQLLTLEMTTSGSWTDNVQHLFTCLIYLILTIKQVSSSYSLAAVCIYLTPPPRSRYDTRGRFLIKVQLVWIQSFPSLRLVEARLKNLVYPTIYL